MRLLIDAGNTRLKWQLDQGGSIVKRGADLLESAEWRGELAEHSEQIDRIAVSTVMSETGRQNLVDALAALSDAPVRFFWSEVYRRGLENAYADVSRMGADRWHAMYAAWLKRGGGFAVIDAGSAITVDYVGADGRHLGGYILPGKRMMLRSLQQDAARIGFESIDAGAGKPGVSTTECVQHGLVWLWQGLIRQLLDDCRSYGVERVLCTGGDAPSLLSAGLQADHDPDLVLKGLGAIDAESGV